MQKTFFLHSKHDRWVCRRWIRKVRRARQQEQFERDNAAELEKLKREFKLNGGGLDAVRQRYAELLLACRRDASSADYRKLLLASPLARMMFKFSSQTQVLVRQRR